MKTDYFGHDEVYRRKKAAPEFVGWDENESFKTALAIATEVMAWPEVPDAGRLLELGCGAANQLAPFAGRYEVSGIDISPTAVEWGREVMSEAGVESPDLVVGDVRELPWSENEFDVVRDGHLLHCIIGADRKAVFDEVRRVLKPNGVLVVFTMCGEQGIPENAGFDPATRLCIVDGVASRYIGRADDLAAEIEAAGIRSVANSTSSRMHDSTEEFVAVARPRR